MLIPLPDSPMLPRTSSLRWVHMGDFPPPESSLGFLRLEGDYRFLHVCAASPWVVSIIWEGYQLVLRGPTPLLQVSESVPPSSGPGFFSRMFMPPSKTWKILWNHQPQGPERVLETIMFQNGSPHSPSEPHLAWECGCSTSTCTMLISTFPCTQSSGCFYVVLQELDIPVQGSPLWPHFCPWFLALLTCQSTKLIT